MRMVTRLVGPCFAAEVDGMDLTRPLSEADVLTYAVLAAL